MQGNPIFSLKLVFRAQINAKICGTGRALEDGTRVSTVNRASGESGWQFGRRIATKTRMDSARGGKSREE
jgi:hypothetical protein